MRKKVLEVIRQGQIGGGESHLLDLIHFIDKERYEPVCLSYTDGEMIRRLISWGIECHVIDSQKAFDIKMQRQIKSFIAANSFDLIHAHGSRAASNVLYAAKSLHIPFVYTVHGWSFHEDQSFVVKKVRSWSEKLICYKANCVICVSQSNADTGREVFGLKDAVVIENGINLDVFNKDYARSLRQQFCFSEDDFVVGFVARITKQKNPLIFLEAIEKAHHVNPCVKGLFVGEGDMDSDVDAFMESHAMSSYVYRSKFRTDVPDILKTMDIYCLPSLWEGLSIALLEAMAMGKAIIATPTDGTKEIIVDRENGMIVPFNDSEQLSATILELYSNRQLLEQCGYQASQMIFQRFNAQRVAESVMRVYDTVLKSS